MSVAVDLLATLKRKQLIKVADQLTVELSDRRSKQNIIVGLLEAAPLRAVLEALPMTALRELCATGGLALSGRKKSIFVERLTANLERAGAPERIGGTIEALSVRNYKSFADAELPLAGMTLLIGANASGKSNLLEVIALLSWLANGGRLAQLESAIRGGQLPIRGRATDMVWGQGQMGDIHLGCRLAADETHAGLELDLALRMDVERPRIVGERLVSPEDPSRFPLYDVVEPATEFSHALQVEYNNFSRGRNKPRITCVDEEPVFTQLTTPARFGAKHVESQARIPAEAARIQSALSAILFLDPSPRRMRGYSYRSDNRRLLGDGSNLSSILYELTEARGQRKEILGFIQALPEQEITDIGYVETPRNEVMVTLTESFGRTRRPCEAALLSDGTLRVLAVGAALLSVPEETLVVIEEIDNGVHPSRARTLLERIQQVAERRNLRVLLTTHNPALLDALPDPLVQEVVVCFRDPESGRSRLTRLGDADTLPTLLASGPLGRAATTGLLDRHIKDERTDDARQAATKRWLEDLLEAAP